MEKKLGNFALPEGEETTLACLVKIFECLDIKSVFNLIKSCLIKHLKLDDESKDYIANILYKLIERYRIEFPRGTEFGFENQIPTPIVCACERGRMDDVELFINLHPFHKYITNRDVNGYRDDMTLKDMVNQVGTNSEGYYKGTPLMIAVLNEHFHVVKYLIEQGEADPNIANSNGWNALHYAANNNRTITELIELLLTHMSLDSINKKDRYSGQHRRFGESTPLDLAYYNNVMHNMPIQQEIIALLRSKGGKANRHDKNGRDVGAGNGDLNDYPSGDLND